LAAVAAVDEAICVFAAVVSSEATDVVRQRGFEVALGLVLDLVDEVLVDEVSVDEVSVVCCGVVSRKGEVSGRLLLQRYA